MSSLSIHPIYRMIALSSALLIMPSVAWAGVQPQPFYFHTIDSTAIGPGTDIVTWGGIASPRLVVPPEDQIPVELVSLSLTSASNIAPIVVSMMASDNGTPPGAGPGTAGNMAMLNFGLIVPPPDDNHDLPLHFILNMALASTSTVPINFVAPPNDSAPDPGTFDSFFDLFFDVSVPDAGIVRHMLHFHTDYMFAKIGIGGLISSSFAMGFDLTGPAGTTLGNGAPLFTMTMTAVTVPEPATLALLGLGLAGLGFSRRKKA